MGENEEKPFEFEMKMCATCVNVCKLIVIIIMFPVMMSLAGDIDGKQQFVMMDRDEISYKSDEGYWNSLYRPQDKQFVPACRLIVHNFDENGVHVNFGSLKINNGQDVVNVAVGVEREFTVLPHTLKDAGWKPLKGTGLDQSKIEVDTRISSGSANWLPTLATQVQKEMDDWRRLYSKSEVGFYIDDVTTLSPKIVVVKVNYNSTKFPEQGVLPRWYFFMEDGSLMKVLEEGDACRYDGTGTVADQWVAVGGVKAGWLYGAAGAWAVGRLVLLVANVLLLHFNPGGKSGSLMGAAYSAAGYVVNTLPAIFLSLQPLEQTPMLVSGMWANNLVWQVALSAVVVVGFVLMPIAMIIDEEELKECPAVVVLLRTPGFLCLAGTVAALIVNIILAVRTMQWSFLLSWGLKLRMSWPSVTLAAKINTVVIFTFFLIILDALDFVCKMIKCVAENMF